MEQIVFYNNNGFTFSSIGGTSISAISVETKEEEEEQIRKKQEE